MRSRIVRCFAVLATVLLTLSFAAIARATTLPLSIDSGGAASGSFVADTDFSGGNTSTTTATIDTSAVSTPAPQAVYQSERWGACTYTITGLTPLATYNIALHFAEIYWTKAGQREFNVSINGTQVLTNFDIVASTGAENKAIVKSFTSTANSSGQVVIQFSVGAADQPKISGIVITGATEAPYGGSPAPVPGTVQAENYDTGGQGLAYNVTSINGTANGYRTDGVDLETTTDTGGGYNLGWTAAGQWFNYTVNVAEAGPYTISFRVANGTTTAGTLNVQNTAGTNLTGNVTINPTGGWQTWTTVNATATLPAGKQTLTVYQVSGGYNINWFSLAANVPTAPTGLTATAGNTKVSLSWTAAANAPSYNVYRGTTAGGESSTAITTGVAGTTYADTSVTNGTKYYYTVKAVNVGGTSTASNEASATPLPPVPAAPTGLTATAGNTTAALTWTATSGATAYNVYRGTTAGGESSTPIASGLTSTGYSDSGLMNGTTYFYVVKAVNLGGSSAASNEASARPLPPAPSAPTGLGATAGNATVSLVWTASSGATAYNVYRGTSAGGESSTPIASGVTSTGYSDSGLTNGTTYYYVVKAVNLGGTSGASNEASATPLPPAPAAPTGLSATGGNTTVSLNWTASSGATAYNVYRGTTAGGESSTAIASGVTSTAYSDSGLTNGTTYYYVVKAVNLGGTSGASNEASATPLPPAPAAPTGLTAAAHSGAVALSWTASSGATSYNVYRGAAAGGESSTAIATGLTGTAYADNAVTNGLTYYYTVKAVNTAGTSGASNEASATPVDTGTPYGGVYAQLPGTVYAENYDAGGQGVGYSVTSVNGTANYYRTDGVDLEPCFDNTNGHDVGWSSTGQWFNYTVEAPNAGTYSVTFRVAAGGSGGSFHLANGAGASLTGTVTVGGSGGWQNWTNVTSTVTLPAGVQTLTFVQDTGGYNLNYISFSYNGTGGPGGLQASGQNGKVALLWNGVSGATSYNLYRGTVDGDEGTTPYLNGLAGTSITDTGVANGTKYYYTVAAVTSTGTTGMSNESSATPTVEGPYGGTPWSIPGTIQVENYDVGGEGVGFHDGDATNDGGAYRSDGVDIEGAGDLGGGYDVGWTAAGEWLNYTVNVTAAGSYVVQVRVASNGQGGTVHFNVNGTAATSEISVPDTGGWQVWDTLSTPITLSAGQHVITLSEDAAGPTGGMGNFNWFSIGPAPAFPNFGGNVFVFGPSTAVSTIASTVNTVYEEEEFAQFGSNRCALMFQPGTYNVDVPVGYYTQVLGLGQTPDSTVINGYVQQNAALNGGNSTCNFWTGLENLAVNPVDSGGTDLWSVSQADPVRRVHIKGGLSLSQGGASGGVLSDSLIDGQVNAGSQQQWISRNDQWASWSGSVWNMVFVGDINAPAQSFPSPPYTTIASTPVVREKPTLTVDSNGNYSVFVPALRSASSGTTWSAGSPSGTYLPISQFYIAQPGVDNASTINAALSSGLNLILTPGIYVLNGTIQVSNPNTVVLGLGLPTLEARGGITALSVADVDGVSIAGVMIDAGSTNSPVLMQVGPAGSSVDHSSNPTLLSDVFFRVGGGEPGAATVSLQVNSNNVIGDDLWIWRADHGNGVGWTSNTGANGLVVNGNNVTMYGLAVEHYQQYQTLWNGNAGSTYFYQSECPYDVPNQASWMDGTVDGYASYKVANTVTSHQAYGLGVYCLFTSSPSVALTSAIEAPTTGSTFTDMVTDSLGGVGTISHIVNGAGGTVNSSSQKADLVSYP